MIPESTSLLKSLEHRLHAFPTVETPALHPERAASPELGTQDSSHCQPAASALCRKSESVTACSGTQFNPLVPPPHQSSDPIPSCSCHLARPCWVPVLNREWMTISSCCTIWEFPPLDILGYLWIFWDIFGYQKICRDIFGVSVYHVAVYPKKISHNDIPGYPYISNGYPTKISQNDIIQYYPDYMNLYPHVSIMIFILLKYPIYIQSHIHGRYPEDIL